MRARSQFVSGRRQAEYTFCVWHGEYRVSPLHFAAAASLVALDMALLLLRFLAEHWNRNRPQRWSCSLQTGR